MSSVDVKGDQQHAGLDTVAQRFAHIVPEETTTALEDIANPIDTSDNPEAKIRELVVLSQRNRLKLQSAANEVDRQLGTSSEVSCKKPERIRAKALRPDVLDDEPWFEVEHVRDALRFRTSVRQFAHMPDAFDIVLRQRFGIVKIDLDKMTRPGAWGWRFAGFDLRMPEGSAREQIVEYYLTLEEVMSAGTRQCHRLFEKWRNRSKEERIALSRDFQNDIEESRRQYSMAWNAAPQRLGLDANSAEVAWLQVRQQFP